jgi:GTPase involved in cell partitioning and DNA repair
MKNKRTDIGSPEGDKGGVSGEVWISKDTEVDEEIDRETRQFLNELQESKKSNRMLVGWRPD